MEKIAIIPAATEWRQENGMQQQPQSTNALNSELHVEIPSAVSASVSIPEPIQITSKPTWTLEQGQPAITGLAGLFAMAFCAALTAAFSQAPHLKFLFPTLSLTQIAYWDALVYGVWAWRYPLFCGFVGLTMIATEVLYVKSYRRHFDFAAPRAVDSAAWDRIRERGFALFCCLVSITFLYVFLGEYRFYKLDYPIDWYYAHFRTFFIVAAPTLLILCWPYFWLLECYGKAGALPDELLILAAWIRKPIAQIRSSEARQKSENQILANFGRGLLVKIFFVPIMISFCWINWQLWEDRIHQAINSVIDMHWSTASDVAVNIHVVALSLYTFILLVDVTVGLLGYLSSTRLLDTQVVSAEPTLFGWLVAIVWYPPFQQGISLMYLHYSGHDIWPEEIFQKHPTLAVLATLCSLVLMAIYVWSTLSFGLRFSNLTNRGIVCCGPYAVVRHPAYICKNTAWWIEATPAMINHPEVIPLYVVRLIATNVIYGLRAITEERHLIREPHYQEYCKKVSWRFIPGLW